MQQIEGVQVQQQQVFEQFANVIYALTEYTPLLLVIDDLQWADRGSIDLLFYLGHNLVSFPVILLGAYRSEEIAYDTNGRAHHLRSVVFELQRQFGDILLDLDEVEKRAFIDAYLDSNPNGLDEGFREALYRQTDGHPLFTVELLRDLQERGELYRDDLGHWVAPGAIDWSRLPARVEGTIGERIYRLPDRLQQILAVASVEGEFFTAEVIARVLDADAQAVIMELSRYLDKVHRLVQAEGFVRLKDGRFSTYRIRHVLIQNYVYERLDVVEKAHWHEAIAHAFEELHDDVEQMANTIAQHYKRAGVNKEAIQYLYKASIQAMHRFAHYEATQLINEALELVETLPEGQERNILELDLQLLLGPIMLMTKGLSDEGVIAIYDRAHILNQHIENNPNQFAILSGLWAYYLVRGDLPYAMALAQEFLDLSYAVGNIKEQIAAHFTMLFAFFVEGQFQQVVDHAAKVDEAYEVTYHHELFQRFGQDPGLMSRCYCSFAVAFLGFPDKALTLANKALTVNRQVGDPFNLALALYYLSLVHHVRKDHEEAMTFVEEAILLVNDYGFTQILGLTSIIKGWCLVEIGQFQEGQKNIEQGLDILQKQIGQGVAMTHYVWVLADTYAKQGQFENSLQSLDEALEYVDRGGKFWEANVHLTKGEVMFQMGVSHGEVESEFLRALEIAQAQDAKLFELQAAISLARFYHETGRGTEAYSRLKAIYDWFEEGLDTFDLRQAEEILQLISK